MKTHFVLFCLFCISAPLFAETLRDVLVKNKIPTQSFSQKDLHTKVSSGYVRALTDATVLAYPSLDSDGSYAGSMFVIKRAVKNGSVIHRRLSSSQVSDVCLGSVLGIDEQAGDVLLKTDISPSALCTLVLDSQLQFKWEFMGWSIGDLGKGLALFKEDEIHFAPVHALRLAVVDLMSGKSLEVYPPNKDEVRADFATELERNKPSEKWCQENNTPCEPDLFDNDIVSGPVSNAAGALFTFIVNFEPDAFGEQATKKIGTRYASYVFRRDTNGWNYCSRKVLDGEMEELKGSLSTDDLGPMSGLCRESRKLKVDPIGASGILFKSKSH